MNFVKQRIRTDVFTGLPLTILVIICGFILVLFLGITKDILFSSLIENIDRAVAIFFSEHRSFWFTRFFLSITYFGNWVPVLVLGSLVSLALLSKKHFKYGIPLMTAILGSGVAVYVLKLLIGRDRPGMDIAYYVESSHSFPSGHAALSVALYAFLAYFLMGTRNARHSAWVRISILSISTAFILLIGLSRLYLGVHYLSDVIGGYILGVLWLIIAIILTKTVWKEY